jgi:hypothetical protein
MRYERMLAQCADVNATRQAREDGLIATITQISSAALLAVPGFLLSGSNQLKWPWMLEFGLVSFGVALMSAMAEQHLSAKAHAKHIQVVQKYYLLESRDREDKRSRIQVRCARRSAYLSFVLSVVLTSFGLFHLGVQNG